MPGLQGDLEEWQTQEVNVMTPGTVRHALCVHFVWHDYHIISQRWQSLSCGGTLVTVSSSI